MNLRLPFLASTLAIIASSCVLADWPEFRGPTRDGAVVSESIPTTWAANKNVRWRTQIPGEGWSSPIVVGNKIYLTAAIPVSASQEEAGYELVLLSLHAESGRIEHRIRLFEQPAEAPRIHKKNSHASPTPLYDGENIFVHFGHQGTACVSPQGEILWRNATLDYPPVHGNGGSPSVVGDLLVFSRDGGDIAQIAALNKRTGAVVWTVERDVDVEKQFSFCTPIVLESADREQLILPGSNVVQSLDPKTGREIWRLRYDGYSVIPRPIYEAGLLFVCTGYNRPSLLAIDPTGTGDVTDTHLKWRTDSNVPHTSSVIALNGRIAMVSDKGIASCLDARTGKQLWQKRIGGNFSASPLRVGNHMYLLSETGDCTILDIRGKPIEIAKNRIGERCLASLAVVESDLLLRSADALYRISSN